MTQQYPKSQRLRCHIWDAHPVREYGPLEARWVMQPNGSFRIKDKPKTEEDEE